MVSRTCPNKGVIMARVLWPASSLGVYESTINVTCYVYLGMNLINLQLIVNTIPCLCACALLIYQKNVCQSCTNSHKFHNNRHFASS